VSETLLGRAQAGDADAFTALCAPYEGLVYRHCLQMLKNEADAQDAAQEAMLRAYRSMGRFRGLSSVPTWLYRIAHNVCLDMLKSPRLRAHAASLEALGEAGFDLPDPAPTPEDAYAANAERERLLVAIHALPKAQQALLSLRYGEGMSYEALAEALHLSEGTVKSRLSRLRDKLHALLGGG
jgi:RNA polymerase sigma-70 factor (ECF subfamily)